MSGASQILGIYQQIRHFLVSRDRTEYEQKLRLIEKLTNGINIEEIMSLKGRNFSYDEIIKITQLIENYTIQNDSISQKRVQTNDSIQGHTELSGQIIGRGVQEQLEDIKGMESKQREFISIINHDKLNEGQNI